MTDTEQRVMSGINHHIECAKRADSAAQGSDREYYLHYRQEAFTHRKIAREAIGEL